MAQDGVLLIVLPMLDNPETWIHYLTEAAEAQALPPPDLSGE
jgi:hypothetical protein